MNHLKLTGHQPSPIIKDKRNFFSDYKRCYTCNLEVDGYWNLMNHRKLLHPSNKRCRNFPDGKCTFGKDCWYVHAEDLMDTDESFKQDHTKHECYNCHIEFDTKDKLKKHKKLEHAESVKKYEKFLGNKCERDDTHCWYIHKYSKSSSSPSQKDQVFCEDQKNPFPPEHVQRMFATMDQLFQKVQKMEEQFSQILN